MAAKKASALFLKMEMLLLITVTAGEQQGTSTIENSSSSWSFQAEQGKDGT